MNKKTTVRIARRTTMVRRTTSMLCLLLAVALALPLAGCSVRNTGNTGNVGMQAPDNSPSMFYDEEFNTEEYTAYDENGFVSVFSKPTSTFSASVDTASYANMRRMINDGTKPKDIPSDAVRVEEFLNYFTYDFITPKGNDPFAVSVQIADCPWNPDTLLLIVGLQAQSRNPAEEMGSNLVFLIDVSGSMNNEDKLPLLKKSFSYLVDQLNPNDRVSIVTYAGSDRVVLEGVYASDKKTILKAIDNLTSGGSTAGQMGLKRAYEIAEKYYIEGGNNRIIMASDGDLNVGITSQSDLNDYVSKKRESGVYLSVLGFGAGNYKDNKMKTIAQNGNGNYHYIDCIDEARKVFGEDLTANLYSVADDVKIKLEFNPAYIKGYRQIGYETRQMSHEDFSDDKKDAAELGAGHQVIVAYEIVMNDSPFEVGGDPLKYQSTTTGVENGEWFTIAIRYKDPGNAESKGLEFSFGKDNYTTNPDADWVFASAIIEFAMIASRSDYVGTATLDEAIARAKESKQSDKYRDEFVKLLEAYARQND